MKIIKSETFKVGICSVRPILEDKTKTVAFENGDSIEVTKEQLEKLVNQLGWAKEAKDDSSSKNIRQKSENRDTQTN
jgi:hypothetical protein